jgi:transposase
VATGRDRGGDPAQAELRDAKKRIGQLERALGNKTYELEAAGELSRDWT